MAETDKTKNVQSLLVGFKIIEFISKYNHPLKFNEIHEKTKITKSNLYKYLNTLTSLGILHRDKENGLYTLGSTLIQYGMSALNKEDVASKMKPYLNEINLQMKETTLLTVWTHDGPMIMNMIHSSKGLNLGGQVGTVLPINSAAGKIFAALLDDSSIKKWKETEYNRLNDREINELEAALKKIRDEEIAFAEEALARSVASVAIPVFNYNHDLLGSVIVVGFEDAIPKNSRDEKSLYLIEKGKEISAAFGDSE
ncbi:IclR family transcriptional regulator [Thalassobacillus sp. CUG 92003]|uniref:IclR family transcriptional regulator n=1 Tax=Thalassobacillus sp. CUG 92003 TaxID=2736641 RepID=UPI0015E6B9F8|nr:IclR family transcriptional regulator [Thalassobacillus sp. CUG 92003]